MSKYNKTYWVGQIPSEPLSIQVKDQRGNDRDLSEFSSVRLHMLDSDNRRIDLNGSEINLEQAALGRVIFSFPRDKSVFTKFGEYVIQLELRSLDGSKEFTNQFTLRVRELGRVYR